MARKRDTSIGIEANDLVEGDVIIIGEGNRAKVVSLGKVSHTITQEVPVNIVAYELLDGEWAGARANTSLLGSEEIVIEERLSERRSWWARWFNG